MVQIRRSPAVLAIAATAAVAGCSAPAAGVPRSGSARAALAQLEVAPPAPMTGYRREDFGQPWSDDVTVPSGHNGCDQRSDAMRRDLLELVIKPRTQGCVVLSGRLDDPYTGQLIPYVRGAAPALVSVDHVVALGNAWQSGAQRLTAGRHRDLANDPLNLLVVSARANMSKGDQDASRWTPPAPSFRCRYAARQVAVKLAYGLRVTASERAALAAVLDRCSDEPLPADQTPPPPSR